jgi:AcrR family transcriptional regulator
MERVQTDLPIIPSTDTRTRILEASATIFSVEGFAGASTRTLAAGAGVNIATLNYHFGSKEGVYRATMEWVYDRIACRIEQAAPTILVLPMREALSVVFDVARAERVGIRMVMREILDLGHLRESTAREHVLPSLERHVPLLSGALRITPERARRLVVTLSFLIARFAVQDDVSLAAAFGVRDDAALRDAIVESLYLTTRSFVETL